MRLDKYLKVSRLIKRRTLAKEVCDAGHVCINDKVAKAASEVRIGDVLTVHYGARTNSFRILKLAEQASVQEAREMYEPVAGTAE